MADPGFARVRVLISSTTVDLAEYREAAFGVLKRLAGRYRDRVFLEGRGMEDEPQSGLGETTADFSARMADDYEWVVVLVAFRYGSRVPRTLAGGDSISHTELEFNRATRSGQKRVFVFMAGDPAVQGDVPYNREAGERDLKDWRNCGSVEDEASLKRFRAELRQGRVTTQFSNLRDFVKKLEDALDQAVLTRLAEATTGEPLALLIKKVAPAIKSFGRKVRAIEKCKDAHDCLHKLRQLVIRRLQEEVLPAWQRDGQLSKTREMALIKRLNPYNKLIGQLEEHKSRIQRLGGNNELRVSLENVLRYQRLWRDDPDEDSTPEELGPHGYELFADSTSRLSSSVEVAFEQANERMIYEERDLHTSHDQLELSVAAERRGQALDAKGEALLDSRMTELRQMLTHMRGVLAGHDEWQRMHIAVHNLETQLAAAPGESSKRLKDFCAARLFKLEALVVRRFAMGSAPFESALAAKGAEPFTASEEGLLKDLTRTIDVLRGEEDKSKESFISLRKYFDDVFFAVDTLTLHTVQTVSARVQEIEVMVDQLVQGNEVGLGAEGK